MILPPLVADLHESGPMVPRGWAPSDQFSSNSRSVNLFPLNRRENKECTTISSGVIYFCINVYIKFLTIFIR